MKKEEVKHLENEFSTLFKPHQHQQSLSQQSQTNLLDSQETSQQLNSATFKQVPLNESESEADFLDQIDDLLDHSPDEHQLTRREIMLNFKLNELKLMCKNLKGANAELAARIEQLQLPHSEIQAEKTVQVNRSQDLTMMQQEFTEIEEELTRYKQQLAKHQQQMEAQMTIKNEEIRRARQEVNDLKASREAAEWQLRQRGRVINLLEQRNEELLLMIEELQANQEPTFIESNGSFHFNQQISQEMQAMIDKLMKELKYEKRTNTKQLAEIKRLNGEIIMLESKMKEKNNKIYELELAAIKMNKPQYNSPRGKTSRVNTEKQEQFTAYQPQRNFLGVAIEPSKNKTQTNIKSYNKNRISAQREGGGKSLYPLLPLSKVFSTFTLMDLLNKQFKIRTAQKYFIASRVVELYTDKLNKSDYDNLIPQEIEIYNFSSQSPAQLRVRVNAISRSDRYEVNEESLLYNMGFVLDTLLNQVQVIDAYLGTMLELNIPDYIELVLSKQSKEEKQKILIQLATSIEKEYLSD